MRAQYYAATSLDGFIATEDDSLEWLFPWPIPRTRATPEVRRYGDGLAELRYALRRPSI